MLIAKDKATPGGGDYPSLTQFLRGRSREELAAQAASARRLLEHDRWSLRAVRTALGEPVAPDPAADAFAAGAGRRMEGDPLAGKTREQITSPEDRPGTAPGGARSGAAGHGGGAGRAAGQCGAELARLAR